METALTTIITIVGAGVVICLAIIVATWVYVMAQAHKMGREEGRRFFNEYKKKESKLPFSKEESDIGKK